MENYDIAKEAFRQIVWAIIDLEKVHQVYCPIPDFIEVNGERFYKNQLYIQYSEVNHLHQLA